MELLKQFQPPHPRMWLLHELPENEMQSAWHVWGNLRSLTGYAEDVASAVALFEYSLANSRQIRRRSLFSNWAFCAARDGAMSLYHYSQSLRSVRGGFKNCPTLRAKVDHKALRDAEKAFKDGFPAAEQLRHAIAHSAELADSLEKRELNSVRNLQSGSFQVLNGSVMIRDQIDGCRFSYSFNGELVYYDVNSDTILKLNEITQTVIDAFEEISAKC